MEEAVLYLRQTGAGAGRLKTTGLATDDNVKGAKHGSGESDAPKSPMPGTNRTREKLKRLGDRQDGLANEQGNQRAAFS